jgi:hypothetical protein
MKMLLISLQNPLDASNFNTYVYLWDGNNFLFCSFSWFSFLLAFLDAVILISKGFCLSLIGDIPD